MDSTEKNRTLYVSSVTSAIRQGKIIVNIDEKKCTPSPVQLMRCLLRQVQKPISNVIIVCYNDPVHAGLERVFEEDKFNEARLWRLAPYSALLNPIEDVWSVINKIQKRLNETMRNLLHELPTPGMTQLEQRLLHLENMIDLSK